MTPQEYQALKDKMDELNKRKRILEFSNATAKEWYDLAREYEIIDSRANHHHCITRAVHYASMSIRCTCGYDDGMHEWDCAIRKAERAQEPAEPEPLHQWQTIENMGGG
jgi:hypothetical protein